MGDANSEALSHSQCMANPQIPDGWHPESYTVDEFSKVVWKQGGHAVAMGLKGKQKTLIPGYIIALCTGEELRGVRHRIKIDTVKREDEEFDSITDEEWKEFWAEEIERSRAKRVRKKQELLHRRTKLAAEAGRSPEAPLITEEEWHQVWKKRAADICFKKGKAASEARGKEETQAQMLSPFISRQEVNGRKSHPIVSFLLLIVRLPYLVPFMGWIWFGIVIFNWQRVPWFALIPVVFWSLVCSKSVGESGEIIKSDIRENGGVIETRHEVQMILLSLLQYPTFLTAVWILLGSA